MKFITSLQLKCFLKLLVTSLWSYKTKKVNENSVVRRYMNSTIQYYESTRWRGTPCAKLNLYYKLCGLAEHLSLYIHVIMHSTHSCNAYCHWLMYNATCDFLSWLNTLVMSCSLSFITLSWYLHVCSTATYNVPQSSYYTACLGQLV